MAVTRYILMLFLLLPAAALARETVVQLDDGSSVKVFLFEPKSHGDGPWPLCVLMTGGSGNEYVARAQFWLGRELANQGWMIAVPVSPDNTPFTGENGRKIPKVIEQLQYSPDIMPGKVLLVGVSTGGSSALELAAQTPQQYYGVVAVPGMLKDLSVINDMQQLPVYLRIAENDLFRWHHHMPALVEALSAGGAQVNAALVPEGRHVFRLNWDELQPWLESLNAPKSISP
jgi:dienelactone hydrolase